MQKLVRALRPWTWCLIGGRAVEIWTNPPQTPDVDVLVVFREEDASVLLARLKSEAIELESSLEGDGVPTFFLKDRQTKVEVDVLGAYETMHYFVAERAVSKVVQRARFPVAYAEDIVILKARAIVDIGRPAEKRKRDRKAVWDIDKQVKLNKPYIQETLDEHGWSEEAKMLHVMRIL